MSSSVPKLYYFLVDVQQDGIHQFYVNSSGTSALIAAERAGVKLDFETIDNSTKKTFSGADFLAINPKGNVGTLETNDSEGTILIENTAVLQYISDLAPGKIAPIRGTPDHYKLLQVLSYIGSEVHGSFGDKLGLFAAGGITDVKVKEAFAGIVSAQAANKLKFLNDHWLNGHSYLVGDKFSIADGYLYIFLSWKSANGLSYEAYPNVKKYFDSLEVELAPIIKKIHALGHNAKGTF